MKIKTVLILGATSGIARALAKEFARRRYALILAARDTDELETIAADLRVRWNAKIAIQPFDATNYRTHGAFWKRCLAACDGDLHGVVLCFGAMSPQDEAARDWAASRAMIEANYAACVSIFNIAANYYEARGRGFLAAISSVAGERGRAANYIYGSAKAGVNVYLQGLRQRLAKHNVSVTTAKPGPVDTGMTWGLDKLPLLASPEHVAADIFRAIRRRQDIVYTPAPWRIIMAIFHAFPESVWKKLKF